MPSRRAKPDKGHKGHRPSSSERQRHARPKAKPNPGAGGANIKAGNGSKSTYYFGPLLEYSRSEGLTKYYYAGSRLIARSNKWGKQFYHQDHLDSTRLITDEAGRVVQRYDYAPFGELMSQPNPPSGKLSNDIQFGGQRSDEESGLTYMGARYYDAELGRFTSADTIVPDHDEPAGAKSLLIRVQRPTLLH